VSPYVLDASVILAYLWKETGWEVVEKVLLADLSIISAVNVAEVASKVLDRGFRELEARQLISNLGLRQVGFDSEQAWLTAALRSRTRSRGLSLGDRACLALAKSHKMKALTADKAWGDLKLGIPIEIIR
jgi:PIN domain nuclease of toxin-antitoxin system